MDEPRPPEVLRAFSRGAALLTPIGVVLYGVLRLSHAVFYGRFGVQPEEVGFGYVEVLVQSIVGLLWVVGGVGFFLSLFGLPFFLMMLPSTIRRAAQADDQPPRPLLATIVRAAGRTWERLRPLGITLLVLSVILGGALFILFANGRAGLANDGGSVEPTMVLPWRAERVTASWLANVNDTFRLEDRESLLYLGQADGIAVLHDFETLEVLRVPVDSIVLCRWRFNVFRDFPCNPPRLREEP